MHGAFGFGAMIDGTYPLIEKMIHNHLSLQEVEALSGLRADNETADAFGHVYLWLNKGYRWLNKQQRTAIYLHDGIYALIQVAE